MPQQVFLTLIRYRSIGFIMGFFSMMLFRFPLWVNKRILFFKLMGSGKNGTFDIHPDFHQWAIFTLHDKPYEKESHELLIRKLYGKFISQYLKLFAHETYVICLTPINGHGKWDGKIPFSYHEIPERTSSNPIAVLTRATIRLSRLRSFWKNVPAVSSLIAKTPGFVFSVGIGEIPWIKQATFSVWNSEDEMKRFAYGQKPHQEVIRKTHQEKWYSEDMFVRFKMNYTSGLIHQVDPLAEIL